MNAQGTQVNAERKQVDTQKKNKWMHRETKWMHSSQQLHPKYPTQKLYWVKLRVIILKYDGDIYHNV